MAIIPKPLVISSSRRKPELIVPQNKIPKKILYLSDIDDQEGLRFQMPILMFYKYNSSMKGKDHAKIIKDGLSKTLVFYYPLAGRIIEGPNRKLMVNCNSEGIMFIEADANVELEKLGDSILPPCPYLEELLYNEPGSVGIIGCPLMLVQVTHFTCGGFVVGFKVNHTMMDAYGFKMFLNALSELIQGASAPSILPVWQRDLLSARSSPCITCTHNEFDEQVESKFAWIAMEDKLIQHSFFFGNKEIKAIKDQLLEPGYGSIGRFELLVAFLWKYRTIALDINPEENVRLSYVVNVRVGPQKMELPLGYYGNAFATPAAVSKVGLLCSNPLTYAIELIKQAKNQVNEEYIKSLADYMVINRRRTWTKSWNFLITNDAILGLDEVDFGWGKPILGGVDRSPFSFASFFWSFNKNIGEKSIVIAINLPQQAMEKFQHLIHNFTSKNVEKIQLTSKI
ncbi:methanol O-anthraniloyltransferase-like [Solanum tuberosum]|uniref:Acyltransferase 2 n=1 Tax=Solanum tuberosum TaxID=4113 RepID=M1AJ88_SOLTU|nr:PREDICTED: methanol O-anthraniloyltransferase-like [Solanum tuberosum]